MRSYAEMRLEITSGLQQELGVTTTIYFVGQAMTMNLPCIAVINGGDVTAVWDLQIYKSMANLFVCSIPWGLPIICMNVRTQSLFQTLETTLSTWEMKCIIPMDKKQPGQ